jgi:hypothetical protein
MRKIYILFVVLVTLFSTKSYAQNVVVEADGDNLYYSESGCGDCYSSPDPRWRNRINVGGSVYDWNVDANDFGGCGWKGYTNYSWTPTLNKTANQSIVFSFNGWEEDPNNIFCNGNDADCGGYATLRTINKICDNAPYTWNYFTDSRTCTSDGTLVLIKRIGVTIGGIMKHLPLLHSPQQTHCFAKAILLPLPSQLTLMLVAV